MYHLSIRLVQRGLGQTATEIAARRAGVNITDTRTGMRFACQGKKAVLHSEILAPSESPSWIADREMLWNAAETEKRRDARVAREYEVALPLELSLTQNTDLVHRFAQLLVDRLGVAVDLNVARDSPVDWEGHDKTVVGYHASLLTTTRQVGKDGLTTKALIELSDAHRTSLGLHSGRDEYKVLRSEWARLCNESLEAAGAVERVDARSIEDQGIERQPTVKVGAAATRIERRGRASIVGDANREIVARSQLTEGEEIALHRDSK